MIKQSNTWKIEFETDSSWATLEGSTGVRTIGEQFSPTFRFYGAKVAGKDPPTPTTFVDRYEAVLDHCRNAGKYVTDETTDTAETLFREQHSGESVLVKIDPEYDAPGTRGVWGLISGYEDNTEQPRVVCVLDVDIDILAWEGDYDDHQDVRQSLEMRGI